MPTRSQWKFAEDRLAEFFNTKRRPLSGGNQGEGRRDDGMHDVLFLESKYGKYIPLFNLYRDTKEKARKEGRIPVIGLQEKGKHGILICVHSNDFEDVVKQWAKDNGFRITPRPKKKGG